MVEAPAPSESVHSPVVRAHISHAVIATYVADAVLGVPGVTGIVGGSFGSLERRADPDCARRAVRVTSADGGVGLVVRVRLGYGASAPAVCRAIDRSVRDYLAAMVAVSVGRLQIVVDQIGVDDGARG
jgi:uncharacterized alkaline shock family protein YloU